MLIDVAFIGIGVLLLWAGSEGLVRGAGTLAVRLGVAPIAVGLTVVAFATSSPELFVAAQSALTRHAAVALGTVVGSNIFNATAVLGLAGLVRPMTVRARLVRREMPLMIGATALLCLFLVEGGLSRLDGAVLVAAALAYAVYAYLGATAGDTEAVSTEFGDALPRPREARRDLVWGAVGLAALVVGAESLVHGAAALAAAFHVSEVVVAVTVVAFGTSLPELATSVTAARRGEPDVALGNVIGSNTINILGVLGLAALIHPLAASGITVVDLVTLLAVPLLLIALMARGWKLDRWKGALLLAAYVAYAVSTVTWRGR